MLKNLYLKIQSNTTYILYFIFFINTYILLKNFIGTYTRNHIKIQEKHIVNIKGNSNAFILIYKK